MTKKAPSRTHSAPRVLAARMSELQDNARRAAGLLKAMSNPSRLVILCQLAEGERSVGELEQEVGISQSGISQHLAVLRREHVVASRRERQTVFYSLGGADVVALMATLHKVFCKGPRSGASTARRSNTRTSGSSPGAGARARTR